MFITIITLYSLIMTPYLIVFGSDGVSNFALGWVDFCLDIFFMTDVAFRARTAYKIGFGELETDPWKILKHYARGWLLPDLISSIPVELILVIASAVQHAEGDDSGPTELKFLRLLRIVRVLRVGRLLRSNNSRARFTKTVRLVQVIIVFLLFMHWSACFFNAVPAVEAFFGGYSYDLVLNGDVMSWLAASGLLSVNDETRYIASLYWAVVTCVTLGYGDIVPKTNLERIYAVFVMAIGTMIYSLTFASLAALLSSMNTTENHYYEFVGQISEYMRARKFPLLLQSRVLDYYRIKYEWQRNVQSGGFELMEGLPVLLQTQVAAATHARTFDRNVLLRNVSLSFKQILAIKLRQQISVPGEVLFSVGEEAAEIYFLSRGEVAIVAKRELAMSSAPALGMMQSSSASSSASSSLGDYPPGLMVGGGRKAVASSNGDGDGRKKDGKDGSSGATGGSVMIEIADISSSGGKVADGGESSASSNPQPRDRASSASSSSSASGGALRIRSPSGIAPARGGVPSSPALSGVAAGNTTPRSPGGASAGVVDPAFSSVSRPTSGRFARLTSFLGAEPRMDSRKRKTLLSLYAQAAKENGHNNPHPRVEAVLRAHHHVGPTAGLPSSASSNGGALTAHGTSASGSAGVAGSAGASGNNNASAYGGFGTAHHHIPSSSPAKDLLLHHHHHNHHSHRPSTSPKNPADRDRSPVMFSSPGAGTSRSRAGSSVTTTKGKPGSIAISASPPSSQRPSLAAMGSGGPSPSPPFDVSRTVSTADSSGDGDHEATGIISETPPPQPFPSSSVSAPLVAVAGGSSEEPGSSSSAATSSFIGIADATSPVPQAPTTLLQRLAPSFNKMQQAPATAAADAPTTPNSGTTDNGPASSPASSVDEGKASGGKGAKKQSKKRRKPSLKTAAQDSIGRRSDQPTPASSVSSDRHDEELDDQFHYEDEHYGDGEEDDDQEEEDQMNNNSNTHGSGSSGLISAAHAAASSEGEIITLSHHSSSSSSSSASSVASTLGPLPFSSGSGPGAGSASASAGAPAPPLPPAHQSALASTSARLPPPAPARPPQLQTTTGTAGGPGSAPATGAGATTGGGSGTPRSSSMGASGPLTGLQTPRARSAAEAAAGTNRNTPTLGSSMPSGPQDLQAMGSLSLGPSSGAGGGAPSLSTFRQVSGRNLSSVPSSGAMSISSTQSEDGSVQTPMPGSSTVTAATTTHHQVGLGGTAGVSAATFNQQQLSQQQQQQQQQQGTIGPSDASVQQQLANSSKTISQLSKAQLNALLKGGPGPLAAGAAGAGVSARQLTIGGGGGGNAGGTIGAAGGQGGGGTRGRSQGGAQSAGPTASSSAPAAQAPSTSASGQPAWPHQLQPSEGGATVVSGSSATATGTVSGAGVGVVVPPLTLGTTNSGKVQDTRRGSTITLGSGNSGDRAQQTVSFTTMGRLFSKITGGGGGSKTGEEGGGTGSASGTDSPVRPPSPTLAANMPFPLTYPSERDSLEARLMVLAAVRKRSLDKEGVKIQSKEQEQAHLSAVAVLAAAMEDGDFILSWRRDGAFFGDEDIFHGHDEEMMMGMGEEEAMAAAAFDEGGNGNSPRLASEDEPSIPTSPAVPGTAFVSPPTATSASGGDSATSLVVPQPPSVLRLPPALPSISAPRNNSTDGGGLGFHSNAATPGVVAMVAATSLRPPGLVLGQPSIPPPLPPPPVASAPDGGSSFLEETQDHNGGDGADELPATIMDALPPQRFHTVMAVATCFCELYALPADELKGLLELYPAEDLAFQLLAAARYKKAQELQPYDDVVLTRIVAKQAEEQQAESLAALHAGLEAAHLKEA